MANWLGLLGIVGFFLFWELATRFEILNPFYFPPFSKIVVKGAELFADGTIWQHMWFSLTNFSIGFVVAVVIGVIVGVPMGWYRNLTRTFDPLLSGIYATPLIALLPLIIMLFGLGPLSKIIMTVLAAVFPILINTMTGIANTDHRLITMSRAFGAKDSTIFLKVSVTGSLPYIVAGMRVALGRALVYIVVAEQYGAAMGLGYLSSVAAQRFQMRAAFFARLRVERAPVFEQVLQFLIARMRPVVFEAVDALSEGVIDVLLLPDSGAGELRDRLDQDVQFRRLDEDVRRNPNALDADRWTVDRVRPDPVLVEQRLREIGRRHALDADIGNRTGARGIRRRGRSEMVPV